MFCNGFFICILSAFKHQGDAHGFDECVCRLHFLCLIFLGNVPVKADGELDARAFDNFLLGFVFEKLRNVVVRLKGVQAVVVDVDFPKDTVFRHLAEVAVGLFPDRADKGEHIRMRNTDGAAATLGEGENIAARDGSGIVEVFH